MYHICSIYSLTGTGFRILATVNNAAMNMGEQIFLRYPVCFSWYIPRSWIAGSQGSSRVLILWGTSIPFSTMAAPNYIRTNSAQGFPFPYVLRSTDYLFSFWWQPFWQGCGVILWICFVFPRWLVMFRAFSCTCWLFIYLLWKKMSIRRLFP